MNKNKNYYEKSYFTPADLEDFDYSYDLNLSGEFPFTRGVYPTMYRGRLWTMRQYSGYATAEETNKRYRFLLEKGQTGLSIAFDLPTQMGYDSDHPMSNGEVGKVGVAIDTIQDMEDLFKEIPLDKVSVSMTINATAAIVLAMFIAVAEKRCIPLNSLRGTVQNDILKEYIARGTYIFPPKPSLRLVTDIIEFCMNNVPKWNMISISGYHIREAGSTADQELGFTIANGICYIENALKRTLDINLLGRRVSFFFNSHNNFFEEIAKFRAARRLWARIMKERFKATNPSAMLLRFHTQTAGCTLTAQQPFNNATRVALQALAAVLGGTQSLHTNSMDEALSLPTEEAVKLALRTQQIIAYETGVSDIIDPLGGSYFVEHLTNILEQKALSHIHTIDKMGGSIKAVENGFMQKEIEKSAYEYQKDVERGTITTVGVNRFKDSEEDKEISEIITVDPQVQLKQIQKTNTFKKSRDEKKVHNSLKMLKHKSAETEENLRPYKIDCVKNKATMGEITDVLREVFGVFNMRS